MPEIVVNFSFGMNNALYFKFRNLNTGFLMYEDIFVEKGKH